MGLLSMLNSNQSSINFYSSEIQNQITKILGKHTTTVLHSPVPFDMGFDIGGGADVYIYKEHIDGECYLTTDLIGKKQATNSIGNYELMICHPEKQNWGSNLISKLAYYTLESSINEGDTMDLGGNFILKDSEITALIFSKYADFRVQRKKYGIMLLMGITSDELEWAKENGGKNLILKLKESGLYPTTSLNRKSIFNV